MSIKILGGFAKGQIISVPKGDFVRPTSVLLKRRIFDYYQNLDGVIFVDLCAGSGAVGFEAFSRGASKVFLNEIQKTAFKVLLENKEEIILKNSHRKVGELHCHHLSAEKYLNIFKEQYLNYSSDQKENTIIFIDPPYEEKAIYLKLLEAINEGQWFSGQVWIESDNLKGFAKDQWSKMKVESHKVFEQGDSYILIVNFP